MRTVWKIVHSKLHLILMRQESSYKKTRNGYIHSQAKLNVTPDQVANHIVGLRRTCADKKIPKVKNAFKRETLKVKKSFVRI